MIDESDTQKASSMLDLWELRGYEMKHIMRQAGLSTTAFGKLCNRSGRCIVCVRSENVVKSVWRDRLIDAVGDEFYFRELLVIRDRNGTASDLLRDHVVALNNRRQRRPVEGVV